MAVIIEESETSDIFLQGNQSKPC